MKKTLIQVRNLAIGYKGRQLFTDISFDICEGDVILLCGANGSGKTTLLKALAGVVSDVETAMIPTRIPKVKGFTLNEFIRLTCFDTPEAKPDDALGKLSLSHLSNRDISTLSDGEFQKAGLVSALVRNASVILLDEPTAFLDAENRISVLATLREICDRKGIAVIFSTHDLHDGLKFCTKVLAFGSDGRFLCSGNTSESMSHTVSTIFSSSRSTIP